MLTMRPGLTAVALDVDGTLVDSERDGHRVAFNQAFAEAGRPDRWSVNRYGALVRVTGGRRRLEHYLQSEGMPSIEAQQTARRLHRRKTEIFIEMVKAGRVPARPGVLELLDGLAEQDVAIHVVTTGRRAWVEPLLDGLFGRRRFGQIVTGDDVGALKPHPAAYQLLLTRSGLGAQDVVAVEDSANGLAAALAAGLQCVVVTNDYTRCEDMDGALWVSRSFTDVTVRQFVRPALRVPPRGLTASPCQSDVLPLA